MDSILVQHDASLLALSLGLGLIGAWAAGYWMGGRIKTAGPADASNKFDDASLALLGLLLAFTFSLALAKHEQRRTMVIADSNAIGDFYSCASLLKEPVRSNLQQVLRGYVSLRLEIARRATDPDFLANAFRRSEQMHKEMTRLVDEELASGTPIAVPLTNTLNALTSSYGARLGAVEDRLPASVVALLFVSAIVCAMLVGREQGLSRKVQVIPTMCFVLLVSFAVYVTLDLNQPERGLITVNQRPMERLLSSMMD